LVRPSASFCIATASCVTFLIVSDPLRFVRRSTLLFASVNSIPSSMQRFVTSRRSRVSSISREDEAPLSTSVKESEAEEASSLSFPPGLPHHTSFSSSQESSSAAISRECGEDTRTSSFFCSFVSSTVTYRAFLDFWSIFADRMSSTAESSSFSNSSSSIIPASTIRRSKSTRSVRSGEFGISTPVPG